MPGGQATRSSGPRVSAPVLHRAGAMVAGARSAAPQTGRAARVVRLPAGRGRRAACVSPPSAGATVGGAALVARVKGPPCVQDAWARGFRRTGQSAAASRALRAASAVLRQRALLPGFPAAKLRECSTGPSWSCPRASHGAELELSDARTPGRAGAVGRARNRAGVGAVGRAHHRAELERFEVARPLVELELSDARHGAELGCRTRAPPGPSWSCPTRAPPAQAVRICWQTPEGNWPSLDPPRPSSLKGRGMNFRTYSALRQAVAVAVVVAGCATSQKAPETQEAPETYAWAPVRPPAVPGTGLPTPGQPGQVRPQPLPRSPHKRVLPPTREPGLWAGDAPRASKEPEANPTPEKSRANRRDPPAPVTTERRRPECEPTPVPHAGEDPPHVKTY